MVTEQISNKTEQMPNQPIPDRRRTRSQSRREQEKDDDGEANEVSASSEVSCASAVFDSSSVFIFGNDDGECSSSDAGDASVSDVSIFDDREEVV